MAPSPAAISTDASDVDFVVVTETALTEVLFSALQAMHLRIARMDNWCATQLEGSYIPRQALRKFDPQRIFYFTSTAIPTRN